MIFNGTTGSDSLDGTEGNDTFDGNYGNDTLKGWGGDDSIFGSAGADRLAGGAGNDTLEGGYGDYDIAEYAFFDASAGVVFTSLITPCTLASGTVGSVVITSTPRKSEPTRRAACSASRRIDAQTRSVTVSVYTVRTSASLRTGSFTLFTTHSRPAGSTDSGDNCWYPSVKRQSRSISSAGRC